MTAHDGVRWYVTVLDVASGVVLSEHDAASEFPAASAPKVVLLVDVARRIVAGALDPAELLDRRSIDPVGDSGLWQHLDVDHLTVNDACTLVGAVSDNLATNMLLRRVGLDAIETVAELLGLSTTRLHDEIRDERTAGRHAPAFSTATATELTSVMSELALPRALDPAAAALVRGWLATGVDLSLVAGGFGLDPLAHAMTVPAGDPSAGAGALGGSGPLFHKTGSDPGIRVDTGVLTGSAATIAYTVAATWAPEPWPDPTLDAVLDGMHRIGRSIRRTASGAA